MARLVLAIFIVAAISIGVLVIALGVRALAVEGDRKIREATMGRESLSRIAFMLLLALILYVAITGGQV